MGSKKQFEGVYARETSIRISFQWAKQQFREKLDLKPTAINLQAAARIRDEIVSAIRINKFTKEDFYHYFPNSQWLKDNGSSSGFLFKDVVATWLMIAADQVAASTHTTYRNDLNKHWIPVLGGKSVSEIKYEDIAMALALKKIKNGKTFNNIMTPLRRVLNYCVITERIKSNPADLVPFRKVQKASPDPLEVKELLLVLAHIEKRYDEQWLNYFELAFFTGMRPSELIALQWDKIDFIRKSIRVDAARVRSLDKDTKSHHAREIDMQSNTLAALIRQKKHTFLKDAYVFHNPATGRRFMKTDAPVQDVWKPTLRAIGLHDRDARQTRHTFATMCLHASMNPTYVAQQMGHADTRMFFEVYSKWIKGQANDREISKLDALMQHNNLSHILG